MAIANNITRRSMLVAAPAALVAGAASAQGVYVKHTPLPETPVMALFREWEIAADAEDRSHDLEMSDAEAERRTEVRREVEARLLAEPCREARDFICKVIAYTSFGVFAMQDQNEAPELWVEARALIGA